MSRRATRAFLVGALLVGLFSSMGRVALPAHADGEGEVEYNGQKYFCVVGKPWTFFHICVYIETDYTNSPAGLDLGNQGDTFGPDFLAGPDLIRSYLANPAIQNTLIGWSLPNLNPPQPGSAGPYNSNAEIKCAVGNIVHLAITWDGDIHADLGPISNPSISALVNPNNTSSDLISQPALVVEIPLWDRPMFPNLSALRGGTLVQICGRWVVDANADEDWAELHPATSVKILQPPTIESHANLTVQATSAVGAVVSYIPPATQDVLDGTGTASCTPAPGSTFPIGATTAGVTTVTCMATDSAGLAATPTSFTVTVQDTTPPTVNVPSVLTVEATGPSGAPVTFSATAIDLVDGAITPSCIPASGSTFAIAPTTAQTSTVTCSATDKHGNTGSADFTVTVQDTTPPTVTVPTNITVNATGPSGAAVPFTATATDLVDGSDPVTCIPAAGSVFAVGTTTVNCTATDKHGNAAPNRSFTVTVKGAVAQINDLLAAVIGVGPGMSLQSKVQDALSAAQTGNIASACGSLQDFINEVRAQSGKMLTTAQADQFAADATRIRAVLGC